MRATSIIGIHAVLLVFGSLSLVGCATRSISDSGYRGSGWYADRNPLYYGELHEFSVLGIAPGVAATDDMIKAALANSGPFKIPRGSRILLIQSGALMPDEPMQRELSKAYAVAPFAGVPNTAGDIRTYPRGSRPPDYAFEGTDPVDKPNYAGALRLAAARGGCEYILCYWGVLETAQKDLATKTVSWVPIVGRALPDETQEMRIRLKVAGVKVETGQWAMLMPEPVDDRAVSARLTRASSDQAQVALLKDAGYAAAAEEVIRAWGN
jgi:hypothetical protein